MTKEQFNQFGHDIQQLVIKYNIRTLAFVILSEGVPLGVSVQVGCAGTDNEIKNNFGPCGDQMIDALLDHLKSNGVIKAMGRG